MSYRHEAYPARKCEYPTARKNAKSVWALAIASLLALTLSGCGDWRDNPPSAANEPAAKQAGDSGTTSSGTPTTANEAATPDSADTNTTPPPSSDVQTSDAGSQQSAPPPSQQAPDQSDAINSIDVMIDDMRLMNDSALLNVNPVYGWAHGPGYVLMGNDPRGINTPSWWQASNPSLVNGNYLTHMLPWTVMFEGVGNNASNTRIQVRNLRAYVLSKSSGQWRMTHESDQLYGHYCPQTGNYYGCTSGMDARVESTGGSSIKPQPSMNVHAWFNGRAPIDGPDLGAVFVTFEARLVIDNPNGPDDRNAAKYLFHVAGDYYPGDHETVLMPAIAISRAKMVKNEWQAFNMTTLSDVGSQEPGGGITQAQLRANPPPLN